MAREQGRASLLVVVALMVVLVGGARAQAPAPSAEGLSLEAVVNEALGHSPDIQAARARAEAAGLRIPQAKSLPDPMLMFGYQNEGFDRITLGEMENAMGMFSLSQMFFWPGKRGLKAEMASKDAQSAAAMYLASQLGVVSKVKESFYDLFLAYRTLDILKDRTELFARMEDAAAARYASGMGSQQEVVMVQTEKYMLLEREQMQAQRVEALQGMLNSTMGRDVTTPLARPVPGNATPFGEHLDDLIVTAQEASPEIGSKRKMVEAAETKVKMAQKEYYPDVTLQGSYFPRGNGLVPMWNLTATVNLPIYYRSKQKQAVAEATVLLSEAKRNLASTELMVASGVRENYSMVVAADRLMHLYEQGLVPKTNQDVQLAMSGYVTGKTDALTVITRIRNLLDYDLLYWTQFAEREKAIGRLQSLIGGGSQEARAGQVAPQTAVQAGGQK